MIVLFAALMLEEWWLMENGPWLQLLEVETSLRV